MKRPKAVECGARLACALGIAFRVRIDAWPSQGGDGVPLFNGKNLKGWHASFGAEAGTVAALA